MALSTKPNRFYPSIPTVTDDLETHLNALVQIKESIETHERRNGNYMKSFIRYEELVDLGIINEQGELILETGGGTSGVEEAPQDSQKYGRQDAGWLVIDENATHTGEVTGTIGLTVQVSSITNRTAVGEVSESGTDDIALHDATDGSLKKTPINLVTDGGNF